MKEYIIQKGDTLSSIAQKNQIDINQLLSLNPNIKNKNLIYEGQRINLNPTQEYIIQKGDTLGGIAKKYNTNLQDILKANPNIKNQNLIRPGEKLKLNLNFLGVKPKQLKYMDIDEVEKNEELINVDNQRAIQSISHDRNYVIIDKKNRKLSVYDKNNKLLFQTSNLSSGRSKQDYNTITFVDKNGRIREGAGNNSTPAGITIISGVGEYHGAPSFSRARIDQNGNINKINDKNDDIAASFHIGNTNRGSNGCVRLSKNDLKALTNYIGVGTKVYTLPEQPGSKFEVRQGRLSFKANNPYGVTEGSKKYWDDYNTYQDRTYNELKIEQKNQSDDLEYNKNIEEFINSIMSNKAELQKEFKIDSFTYDKLARLAVGIAEQETKFNTSYRKQIKDFIPDAVLNTIRSGARSRGATQIKIKGDNQGMQNLYKKYNITENNVDDLKTSALATMLRLGYMYNTEVRGKSFTNANDENISEYDALLYKWMGRNEELRNKTATPNKNIYINNIKKYYDNFDFLTKVMI